MRCKHAAREGQTGLESRDFEWSGHTWAAMHGVHTLLFELIMIHCCICGNHKQATGICKEISPVKTFTSKWQHLEIILSAKSHPFC